MKVLDLQCANEHSFEGWFASEDDFRGQMVRGLVVCPLCGSGVVRKKLSAPRLNLMTSRADSNDAQSAKTDAPMAASAQALQTSTQMDFQQMQAVWLRSMRQFLAETEDVGAGFAEEARRIHYGETAQRSIRGQSNLEEVQALQDEGIEVTPLLVPESLKSPLQ